MVRFFTILFLSVQWFCGAHFSLAAINPTHTDTPSDSSQILQLFRASDSLLYDEPVKSLGFAEEALIQSQILDNPHLIAEATYRMASALWSKGDLSQSLELLTTCLEQSVELGDEGLIARSYVRLGGLFASVEDNQAAIRYYLLALEKAKVLEDWDLVSVIFNNLGYSYLIGKQFDSAEHYLQRGLWIAGDDPSIIKPFVLFNLGDLAYQRHHHQLAPDFLDECLAVSKDGGERRALIQCNRLFAEIELASGNVASAATYSQEALQLAELSKVSELLYKCNRTRANVLFAQGNYVEAYERQNLAVAYRDSLQTENVKNRLSLFDFELTKTELEELRAKNALVEVQKSFQEVVIVAVSIIAVLALVLAYLFYRSRRAKGVANRLLELKNEQIEEQAGELEDLNTFKTKLIAIISHDLKSPIQGLFGVMDILKRKLVNPEELEEALPSLRRSLKHCNHKISDLLKWSGGTMDDQFLRQEVLGLASVVAVTVSDLTEEAEQKKVTITKDDFEGYFIWADLNIVQTVLRNLLHNAVKFSRKGGEVSIQVERQSEEVIVSIVDKGIGMSQDQLANLFKLRKNIGKGTVGEVGSGIGLIICRDLLEMMGCRLWAVSQQGVGSTFFVGFPATDSVSVQEPATAEVM